MDGSMKITTNILMIAPLAISEQREAIMSTFEYRPTPNVAAKKLNALTITDCIDAPKADVIASCFSTPLYLALRYFVVIRIA